MKVPLPPYVNIFLPIVIVRQLDRQYRKYEFLPCAKLAEYYYVVSRRINYGSR